MVGFGSRGEKEKAILVEEIRAKAERLKLGEVWHHHPLRGTEGQHKPSVGSGFKSLPRQLSKPGVAISHSRHERVTVRNAPSVSISYDCFLKNKSYLRSIKNGVQNDCNCLQNFSFRKHKGSTWKR